MRILVNATTCVVGGGTQVAASFVNAVLLHPTKDQFLFAVSPNVYHNLDEETRASAPISVVTSSPAHPISGYEGRELLRRLEASFRPDVVYTVFGPAYVRFAAPHVCGFADSWVTHSSGVATRVLNPAKRLRVMVLSQYKRLWLSTKDFYWVESEVARSDLAQTIGLQLDRVRVIPNCYSAVFEGSNPSMRPRTGITRVFTLSAAYPHKHLVMIPAVAAVMRDRGMGELFRFIVTLPARGSEVDHFWRAARKLNVESAIENIGQIKLSDCPKWYDSIDILFLPTLLETFSVTYLEAMVMQRPIVTTDLDFAHDICGLAAEYFEPLNAEAAADAILAVTNNANRYTQLVKYGNQQLKKYPTPMQKYQAHIDWLTEVARRESPHG